MSFPFKQARHYTKGRISPIYVGVVHDMEAPQSPLTAENVGNYFAGVNAPQASAHAGVDQDSVMQYVKLGDTAWAAPGANANGFHLEHAGYARQTREQWLKEEKMLNLSSCVMAEFITVQRAFGIKPIIGRVLSGGEIRAKNVSGLCGHIDVTKAFATAGGHTDPGTGFPWDVYWAKIQWWLPLIKNIDFQ